MFTVFTKQATLIRSSTVLSLPLQFRCSNTQYTNTFNTNTHTHALSLSLSHTYRYTNACLQNRKMSLKMIPVYKMPVENMLRRKFVLSKLCSVEKLSVDKMSRHTLFKFCNYKRFISRSDKKRSNFTVWWNFKFEFWWELSTTLKWTLENSE